MQDQPARKRRILLVDDQSSMTQMWKIFLTHLGYLVEEENRSQFAIQTARRFQPDVMILDMQMPVVDGREIAARIRVDEHLPNTHVVFLTSVVTAREVAAGKRIEGCLCLPKPADCKALLRVIEQCLAPGQPPPVRHLPPAAPAAPAVSSRHLPPATPAVRPASIASAAPGVKAPPPSLTAAPTRRVTTLAKNIPPAAPGARPGGNTPVHTTLPPVSGSARKVTTRARHLPPATLGVRPGTPPPAKTTLPPIVSGKPPAR